MFPLLANVYLVCTLLSTLWMLMALAIIYALPPIAIFYALARYAAAGLISARAKA
jgi:hypothetical protein